MINEPNYEEVDFCRLTNVGENLLHDFGVETAELNPEHYFIPWITFNNVSIFKGFFSFFLHRYIIFFPRCGTKLNLKQLQPVWNHFCATGNYHMLKNVNKVNKINIYKKCCKLFLYPEAVKILILKYNISDVQTILFKETLRNLI